MEKKLEKEFKIENGNFSRFWDWLWHSDSIWSWLVALVLAFIVVKFIFFPLLSFLFATSLPLVVVESGSMSHPQGSFLGNTFETQGSFDSWWQENSAWYTERGITSSQASKWSLRNGMEKGDIIVVWGRSSLELGDIIIFNANQAHPIIHRIVKIEQVNGQPVYSTKGDNNNLPGNEQFQFEASITNDQILGKSVFKIPKIGWLKLFFVEIINAFTGN